jgi:hypothetical protein
MLLHRHRCGIIYSQAFAEYLDERYHCESADHPGQLLSLDLVRCATGAKAGTTWYQITWLAAVSIPLADRYRIGRHLVYVHRQTLATLRRRGALDYDPTTRSVRLLT